MAVKWVIKRFAEPEIKVSASVGEQALAAWERGMSIIKLPGNQNLAGSSISAIEATTEFDDSGVNRITSGLNTKAKVVTDLEGNVMTNWYKKNVSLNEWERHYSGIPAYRKLVDDTGAIFVAMRLPEYTGDYERGQELLPCDDHEIRILNG